MNWDRLGMSPRACRRTGMRLLQATALALVVAMAMPARAADERAVKSRVPPVYPEIAKRMKITGTVMIEATVDADGKVTDVKTLSGNHALSIAAEDAVRKWRFVPASSPSTVDVSVNFALTQ
ncbi:MAG TPA: energy transducer TonB [Terracidiphilus sp.]|nr:energy transducer TonB [Terracidiphilus sp.]